MSFFIGLLSDHLSISVLAVVVALYGVHKIRRGKAIAGAVIGIAGSGAFAATVLVIGFAVAIAAGWLDPVAMGSDLVEWAGELWGAVGDWVLARLEEVLG